MAYSTGWEDPQHEDAPPRGGVMRLASTALWAAAGVGLIVAVVMWTYALGARDSDKVAALMSADGGGSGFLSRPKDPGGAPAPGVSSAAYSDLGAANSEATADLALAGAPERPTTSDAKAAQTRIALSTGEPPVTNKVIEEMVLDAVADPSSANRRRSVTLAPAAPRAGDLAEARPKREDLPPNKGQGSEALPPQRVAYKTTSAAAATDGPPAAGDAAVSSARPPAASGQSSVAAATTRPAATTPPRAATASRPSVSASPTAADPLVDGSARVTGAAPAGPAIYQVQLGALDSEADAQRRWSELKAAHGDLIGNMSMRVQTLDVDTGRFYRLRTGEFSSRSAASKLCSDLRERGVDCFPTTR